MKQRPILFSAPMVRALLDGRKTQTRRIIKPQPLEGFPRLGDISFDGFPPYESVAQFSAEAVGGGAYKSECMQCPYGEPGEKLWVRETWASVGTLDPGLTVYSADYPNCVPSHYENVPLSNEIKWKPSIHMFRKDSRILLEITEIRVERLQEISEEDAKAEGMSEISKDGGRTMKYGIPDADGMPGTDNFGWPWDEWCQDPRNAYRKLWEQINGIGSWDLNPWVWVVSFKQIPMVTT